jgi:hypothetical protein
MPQTFQAGAPHRCCAVEMCTDSLQNWTAFIVENSLLFTAATPSLPTKVYQLLKALQNKNLSTVITMFRYLIHSFRTAHNAKNHTTEINFLIINFNWVLCVQKSTVLREMYTHIFIKHRMEPQAINTIISKMHNKATKTVRGGDAASVQTC